MHFRKPISLFADADQPLIQCRIAKLSAKHLIVIAITIHCDKHCIDYVSSDDPSTEQYRKHRDQINIMSCHYVCFISSYEDGP